MPPQRQTEIKPMTAIKRFLFSILILLRHGTPSPDFAILPKTKIPVSINPADSRAYKKLLLDFVRGRESTPMRFWREHVSSLNNPLCLDIGANYGEVMANAKYTEARCIAIEANPELITHLYRTKAGHPQGANIEIVECILGEAKNLETCFYYSPQWTGGGTARPVQGNDLKTIRQKTDTLDSILAEVNTEANKTLLMKIDVEGFEGKVFAGFTSLSNWPAVIGILEFSTHMLKQAGTEPKTFFNFLNNHFNVFLSKRRSTNLYSLNYYLDLERYFSGIDFHCDLVFATDQILLANNWSISPIQHG